MKLPRWLIVSGILGATVLIVVACGTWLLPRILDSRLIRDRIGSELAERFEGSLSVGKVAFLGFPRPHVVMESLVVSFGDRTEGSIETVKIFPSMFYLLMGRLVVRRAEVNEPKIRIRLTESSVEPFELEELERQFRAIVARFAELAARRITVSDGSAEIRIGDKAPVVLENLAAHNVASPAHLRFELSARSNLFERVKIEGKIAPVNLASQLVIGVQRLKVHDSLVLLASQSYLQRGEASFDVKIASSGLRKVKASIDGSEGSFVFAQQGGASAVEIKRLKGGLTYEGGVFWGDLTQLELGNPRLQALGEFKVARGSLSARISARDVDIEQAANLARRIAGDIETVNRILRYVPAGTVPEMSIQSAGRSLAEMALSKNVVLSGVLRDAKVLIPGTDLELEKVTGTVRIANGILEADGVGANLGTTNGRNGKLRLGIDGNPAPFHLDILVHASAPELRSVLLKLVRDEAFRGELLKVRNVQGELSGRLILGNTIGDLSPIVAVSKADISATYEPFLFPIVIRNGRLQYDQKMIRFESAQAAVGLSTFGGLGVTMDRDGSQQIKVESGRISLDLQQTDTLLRSSKDLRSHLEKLQSVRGRIDLNNFTLTGAYDDPAEWTVVGAGRLDQVEITHADFPGRISMSGGKFAANQGRLLFSNIAAAMSDASLVAGGVLEYNKGGRFQFETSGAGDIGGQTAQWLSRQVDLPEELNLRSPLKIVSGHLVLHPAGDLSFRGQITAAGGVQLSLDAVKQGQGLVLRNLTIDDDGQRASITFRTAKDNLDFSFSGEVTQQTIDNIFVSFPIKSSSLRGNIQVSALADPIRVTARGPLAGSNLWIPLATENVLLEEFNIEGSGEIVTLRSADLRWGDRRVAVSGKLARAKDSLRVDLDVKGDQFAWEELQRSFGGKAIQAQQKRTWLTFIPSVEGTIRLKTDRFTFEDLSLSPFEATAAISPFEIKTEIKHGVFCGINTTGRVDVADKEIKLDLKLSARNAQLGPTTICLTNRQNDVKGTYSLTAHVTGRGDQEHLRSTLKGDFELSARNGEFVRSPGIDATFDYLNETGDFKVAFPDLDKETFPYRLVGVKGRIEGKVLIGDEVNVDSALINLSGQGKVDLDRKEIEGKALIAILKPLDEVISRLPLISPMFGGSLVGIPVRITGSLERPHITYLSVADIGGELLNIPLRILGMPLGAMRLFTPSGDLPDKDITR